MGKNDKPKDGKIGVRGAAARGAAAGSGLAAAIGGLIKMLGGGK